MIRKILKKSWKNIENLENLENLKTLEKLGKFEKSWKIWKKITWKFWNNEKMIQKGFWDFRISKIGEKIEKFEVTSPGKNPSLELRYAS